MNRLLRYAAVLLLVLSLPVSYYLGKKSIPSSGTFTTVTCERGDRAAVVLPDRSRVWLNSGSKLTYSNDFQHGKRDLRLEGEAFFTVAKDPRRPFIVSTSELELEVLGTTFNLKAYADEPTITATLVTGSLKVTGDRKSNLMEPSQKLIYTKETREVSVQQLSDLSAETEWKDGRLVFRNRSLEEMEHVLERWFDVEIEFADKQVKARRFTGTLERESILEVISYIGQSKYVGYRIDNNVITFYSEATEQ